MTKEMDKRLQKVKQNLHKIKQLPKDKKQELKQILEQSREELWYQQHIERD